MEVWHDVLKLGWLDPSEAHQRSLTGQGKAGGVAIYCDWGPMTLMQPAAAPAHCR